MTESKQRDRERGCLFNERILQDRNTCDNCFTRIREVLKEFDDVTLPKSLQGCLDDITAQVDAETVYYPSYSVSEGIATVCSRCETEDYIERKVENLKTEECIEKRKELAKRLREDNYVSLEGDLRKAVKERFNAPEYQSKDQLRLFGDAVSEVAVRSGELKDQ